jgi:hypothetical protein
MASIAQFGFAYTSPALPNQRVIAPPPDMLSISICGHGAILGNSRLKWQDTDYVMSVPESPDFLSAGKDTQ